MSIRKMLLDRLKKTKEMKSTINGKNVDKAK